MVKSDWYRNEPRVRFVSFGKRVFVVVDDLIGIGRLAVFGGIGEEAGREE